MGVPLEVLSPELYLWYLASTVDDTVCFGSNSQSSTTLNHIGAILLVAGARWTGGSGTGVTIPGSSGRGTGASAQRIEIKVKKDCARRTHDIQNPGLRQFDEFCLPLTFDP